MLRCFRETQLLSFEHNHHNFMSQNTLKSPVFIIIIIIIMVIIVVTKNPKFQTPLLQAD